jgi:ribosomal protein S18 acetylase RimI-like enzyme
MPHIEIIPYTDALKEHIKMLNVEWLEKYFSVEPNDVISLSNPKEEILDKGGYIYYATVDGAVAGTVSMLRITSDEFELGKMAVSGNYQGLGLGNILMQHCINEAQRLGIKKLILFSNTSLGPAIHLYRKYGFVEAAFEPGHYKRSNIKMEREI